MTTLYNCRHSGDEYRITKFTKDFDVESSYLCTSQECECPAGHRPTCRHREMLPKFLNREHIGDDWFFDYDRGGWVQWEIPEIYPMSPNVVRVNAEGDVLPARQDTSSLDLLAGFYDPSPTQQDTLGGAAPSMTLPAPSISALPEPSLSLRPQALTIRRRV